MPSLGADMDEGTLVEWLKAPGETVARGEVIAVVETQKGAIEIESFEEGVLSAIRVAPGEKVPVGTVLATIGAPGEAEPAEEAPAEEAWAEAAPEPEAGPPARPAPVAAAAAAPRPTRPRGGRRISPAARRRAEAAGLDLAALAPGADGIVGLAEVEAALARPAGPRAAAARPSGGIDRAEMRRAIAAAMARSNREIPHYHVRSTLDAGPLVAWVAAVNAGRPVAGRLMVAAPLLKAVAATLKAVPDLNGHYGPDGFVPSERVHLSTAVALRGGGLMSPAILDADQLTVDETMARLVDLVKRVRGGGVRASELSLGTATLTNLGEDTADALFPVIYPPQVAIVGIGQVRERPFVEAGKVVPRPLVEVTLAGDHRVSDGRTGARFLSRLAGLLKKPEAL